MERSRFELTKRIFTGYTPGKARSDDYQHEVIILITSIAIPVVAIFSVVNFFHDHLWLAALQLVVSALLAASFPLVRNKKHIAFSKNLLMLSSVTVFAALFVDGGIEDTGIIWAPIFPFLAFLLMGLPVAWYWLLGFSLVLATAVVSQHFGLYHSPYSDNVLILFPSIFATFSLIAAIFEMQLERIHLQHEKKIGELEYLKANLQFNIKQRTSALQKANDKLQEEVKQHQATTEALKESEERFYQAQKMEAMGTLVGGIAHDFNNMLAGIIANLFMLKRKLNEHPELHERIDNINQLAGKAADMIKQLLTFARKDHVEYASFDLVPFMNEAYKLASISIAPHIKLAYDFPHEHLKVRANATQLQQVLMNLINNARDAVKRTDAAEIKVTLQRFDADDSFRLKHPELKADSYARFTVSDNGCGIAPDKIRKVFEPFFTTKAVGKGTGLGLAMCYGAIQGHGGTIEVSSTPAIGTSFHVYLPLFEGADDRLHLATLRDAVRGNGEWILLVDDDPALLSVQQETLSALGYQVIVATNGREAVDLFGEHHEHIELVIMDVVMPVMGGVEAAREIRALKNGVRVIFVTGYDPGDTFSGGNLPTSSDFILDKPYTIDELSHVVRKQLLATLA